MNVNFNFDSISEEPSHDYEQEIDDYYYDDDKLEKKTVVALEEKARIEKELIVRTAQLAPMLDRLGRLLTDLAPHVAMIGSSLVAPVTHNHSALSMMTHDGSQISGRLNDPIARFIQPSILNPSET